MDFQATIHLHWNSAILGERLDNYKHTSDTSMVRWMRLVLAIACLLTLSIDPEVAGQRSTASLAVLSAYVLHSLILLVIGGACRAPASWCAGWTWPGSA